MRVVENIFLETFSGRKIRAFEKSVFLIIIVHVLKEIFYQSWKFHSGDFYPRYFFLPPLPHLLVPILQWTVILGLSIFALKHPRLWIKRALTFFFLLSTLQIFSNHKLLLLLILFFLSLDELPEGEIVVAPGLTLIKMQLMLVYWIAALHKISQEFYTGESLTHLSHNLGYPSLSPSLMGPLSCSVIGLQLLLPYLLKRWSTPAFWCLVLFHVGMALFVPSLWIFSLTMIAMGYLYV